MADCDAPGDLSEDTAFEVDPCPTVLSISAQERDAARYMALDGSASSPAAQAAVGRLAADLHGAIGAGKRSKPGRPFTEAVAAIVSDHLRNADPDASRWGYRSHGGSAFDQGRIGYRTFKSAFRGMRDAELLAVIPGHAQHGEWSGKRIITWTKSTRSRGTAALWDRLALDGITPGTHDQHFTIIPEEQKAPVPEPLELRATTKQLGPDRYKGHALPIDLADPVVAKLHGRVQRLNAFVARQDISGARHHSFQRIFNGGDAPGYQWDKGGRLISKGAKTYQAAKPAARAAMTLNGEKVVEIDIAASHLTILHALEGAEMPDNEDVYAAVPLPRSVTKSWVTMTLGHTRFHQAWPDAIKRKLEKELGVPLSDAYPIGATRKAIVAAFPVLAGWGDTRWTWADLQYAESEAVIGAMERLAFDHEVPCLPVHDSIIVPAPTQGLAVDVLSASFERQVGVRPRLKVAEPA